MLTTLGDNYFSFFFCFTGPKVFTEVSQYCVVITLKKNESNFNLYLNSGQTDVTDVVHFFHN